MQVIKVVFFVVDEQGHRIGEMKNTYLELDQLKLLPSMEEELLKLSAGEDRVLKQLRMAQLMMQRREVFEAVGIAITHHLEQELAPLAVDSVVKRYVRDAESGKLIMLGG